MNNGILIGSESEQKNTEDFNLKTNHVSELGNIINITEAVTNATSIVDNNFLSFKSIDGYFYAERQNVDSFAFVLFATNIDQEKRIGLCYEKQPSINKYILKAFTSSIKSAEIDDIRELVIEQVKNQAGFSVAKTEIEYLGKCLVSSKMSEFCHLFGVAVDKTMQFEKENLSIRKNDSGHYWATVEEIKELEDWKAQIIVYKRYLNKKNKILIKRKEG
jgi:hypothetical protein